MRKKIIDDDDKSKSKKGVAGRRKKSINDIPKVVKTRKNKTFEGKPLEDYTYSELTEKKQEIEKELNTLHYTDSGGRVRVLKSIQVTRDKNNKIPPESIAKWVSIHNQINTLQREIDRRDAEIDYAFVKNHGSRIIEYIANGYSMNEVHRILCVANNQQKGGRDIDFTLIQRFCDDNRDEIAKKTKQQLNEISDLPLVLKRRRIIELGNIYRKFYDELQRSSSLQTAKFLTDLLAQVRLEAEGINIKMQVDVEHTIRIEAENAEMKRLIPMQLVLANICAKQNRSPEYFMSKLQQSFYFMWNPHFHDAITMRDNLRKEIAYPSDEWYDMNAIEKKHTQSDAEDRQEVHTLTIIENNDVSQEAESMIQKMKDAFLKRNK